MSEDTGEKLLDDVRRSMTAQLNAEAGNRETLEALHGRVWDTQEMSEEFAVTGFLAPFVVVMRKSDGQKGSLLFQHGPERLYFRWLATS